MRKHFIAPVAAAVMLAVAGSAQAATEDDDVRRQCDRRLRTA